MKLIVPTKAEGKAGSQPTVTVLTPPENTVAIPIEAIDSARWGDHAFLYALDRLTLGISEHSEKKWHDQALFEARVSMRRNGGAIIVELPENIFHFYLLNVTRRDFSSSPKKNKVLVTVGNTHS